MFRPHIQRKGVALVAGAKQLLCGHEGDLQRNRLPPNESKTA